MPLECSTFFRSPGSLHMKCMTLTYGSTNRETELPKDALPTLVG